MPTDEQIKDLVKLGFEVEDMAQVWGSEYQGNWRWMYHSTSGKLLDFGDIEYSEADAWQQALAVKDEVLSTAYV